MIRTRRLTLRPATRPALEAALVGPAALSAALEARVPRGWPPEFLDEAALQFTLERLGTHPEESGWWMYFALAPMDDGLELVGSAGYKGPPDADGTVEVGYGIVPERRRLGLASEATQGLARRAFALPVVQRVIAETLPELVGSIGVLEKCGFEPTEGGSEPGVLRFALPRARYLALPWAERTPDA